jgi:OOP family OmpA-OmpF porin
MKTLSSAAFASHCLGTLALVATFVTFAHATEAASAASESLGPYVGIGLGSSKLGPRHEGNDGPHGVRLEAAKIYGGYQLTDIWGVESGWAHLGPVHNDTVTGDGFRAHHNGDAHSLYVAGTGRLSLGHGFSLTGKAGVSFGRVSPKDSGDADFALGGNKVSPLLGIGTQYSVGRNVALTLDLDGYGKVSDRVKAGTATLGVRYRF